MMKKRDKKNNKKYENEKKGQISYKSELNDNEEKNVKNKFQDKKCRRGRKKKNVTETNSKKLNKSYLKNKTCRNKKSHSSQSYNESKTNIINKKSIRRSSRTKFEKNKVDAKEKISKLKKLKKKSSQVMMQYVQEVKSVKYKVEPNIQTIEYQRHVCTICGYFGRQQGNLKYHMRLHRGEKPYKCDQCDYRTAWKASLVPHKRMHSGIQPYECLHCNRSIFNSNSFVRHFITKHRDVPSAETTKQIQKYNFLNLNIARNRKSASDNQSDDGTEYISVDDPFKYAFYNFSGHGLDIDAILKIYTNPSEDQKYFSCEQCNYCTYHLNFLKLHNIVHSQEKIYRCPYCVLTYITNESKSYHYHIYAFHSGEVMTFACGLCSFMSSGELDFINHTCEILTDITLSQQLQDSEDIQLLTPIAELTKPNDDNFQVKAEPLDERLLFEPRFASSN